MTDPQTLLSDETPLSEVVNSERSVKALEKAGFETLGDVRARPMKDLEGIRYVGPATMMDLAEACGPREEQASAAAAREVEEEGGLAETMDPIVLTRTPGGPSHITWVPSLKHESKGGAYKIEKPAYLVFDARTNQARITPRFFWMRVHERDKAKVEAELENKTAWRNRCVELLQREFSGFGVHFHLMNDG